MKRDDAATLARTLMDMHGLADWEFYFDHARRRAGACHFTRKRITLSAPLIDLYSSVDVRGVILHEVAHALCGSAHHHDALWQKTARSIGASPRATLPSTLPSPPPSWVGTCPRCGNQRKLYSAPRRVISCGKCTKTFTLAYILDWVHNGKNTVPGGAYARELHRLKKTMIR